MCEEAPTASTISTGIQNTLSSSLYKPFIPGQDTTSPSCSFLTYLKCKRLEIGNNNHPIAFLFTHMCALSLYERNQVL